MSNLVVNEQAIRDFLFEVLPVLEKDEVFIYMAFSRKKYNPISNDEWLFHRDIFKNNAIEEMIQKLKRHGKIDGYFKDLRSGTPIPLDAFVYYIDLSPKSTIKAWNLFSKEMNDRIYQIIKDPEQMIYMRKIKNKLMSAIHKSNSRKPYVLLDIDEKDEQLLYDILYELDIKPKWISVTRGGYHGIFEKTPEIGKKLYKNDFLRSLINSKTVEIKHDVMTPIPGTLQGGVVVKKFSKGIYE